MAAPHPTLPTITRIPPAGGTATVAEVDYQSREYSWGTTFSCGFRIDFTANQNYRPVRISWTDTNGQRAWASTFGLSSYTIDGGWLYVSYPDGSYLEEKISDLEILYFENTHPTLPTITRTPQDGGTATVTEVNYAVRETDYYVSNECGFRIDFTANPNYSPFLIKWKDKQGRPFEAIISGLSSYTISSGWSRSIVRETGVISESKISDLEIVYKTHTGLILRSASTGIILRSASTGVILRDD